MLMIQFNRRLIQRRREAFDYHSYGENRRERCVLLTENRAVSGRARPCLTVEATSAAPIVFQIVAGSSKAYPDARNWGSYGECRLKCRLGLIVKLGGGLT